MKVAGEVLLYEGPKADESPRTEWSSDQYDRLPAEWEPHQRTWMAWPRLAIWDRQVTEVRREIALIANTISEHEPVRMLVDERDMGSASKAISREVELIPGIFDDVWVRDTGPIFMSRNALTPVFNGWGRSVYDWKKDALVSEQILGLTNHHARDLGGMVLEGGAIETNGKDWLLTTESCIRDRRRHVGEFREAAPIIIAENVRTNVLSLSGVIEADDVTNGHVDGLVRFLDEKTLLMCLPDAKPLIRQAYLQNLEELVRWLPKGFRLEIADHQCHVNFYWTNGGILIPSTLDDAEDRKLLKKLEPYIGGRIAHFLPVPALESGGGWIHCATLHEPVRQGDHT